MEIESVHVIGAGRVGSAVSARLRERGVELRAEGAQIVLVCVPDAAIPEVAQELPTGPWIAHTSGGTPLSALDPHTRRFSVHPLQTFTLERGPEQLDGAWAAVSAGSDEALDVGLHLAGTLGLHPFELADSDRPLYHAGAVFAASFLVTLHEAAAELMTTAGAPAEALEPLMRRTIDNGFRPTGPFVRGDRGTIERNLAAIHDRRPELEPLYRTLAEATEALVVR
jgi:predicted short-subunit dehydrogenase-like oxidoreductase (DUF2520 family)